MFTATATRIAIRATQILTLTFLLVALADSGRVARAGGIDPDCEDVISWADETLELWEDTEPLFGDVEDAVDDEDPGAVEDAADDLTDAADEQAELDVPRDAEDLNDEIVEAYEDAADAAEELVEAVEDEDEDVIEDGLDAVAEAHEALSDAIEVAEELAEECEDGPNSGGEAELAEVEIELTVVDAESEEPIEDAKFIILREGAGIEDFRQANFDERDEDVVLAVAYSDEDGEISFEAEVEIDSEYTTVLVHDDYEYLRYWEEIVFTTVDDPAPIEIGILTLGEEPEDED